MTDHNVQIVLAQRPTGPVSAACFAQREVAVGELGEGDVLVRNLFVSCDPYILGRMQGGVGYAGGFELDEPIPARAVGQIIASRHPAWKEGDHVWGFLGWQTHAVARRGEGLWPADPAVGPLAHYISVLGMPGLTAWVGMLDIGQPSPGDTVVVSAAAGAVGSLAGQLARRAGARVIGIVGGAAKVDHVTGSLGFDACIDRKAGDVGAALDEFCPNGIDVYFDNVGGPILEAALARLAPFARIPVCGMISGYDTPETSATNGIRGMANMLRSRATMTGFVIYDHMHDYPSYVARMASLLRSGAVTYVNDIWTGIDRVPEAFLAMMHGDNIGKRLVNVG